jgi:hypothetical protein
MADGSSTKKKGIGSRVKKLFKRKDKSKEEPTAAVTSSGAGESGGPVIQLLRIARSGHPLFRANTCQPHNLSAPQGRHLAATRRCTFAYYSYYS